MSRKSYPSDVTDDEWNFVAPYLALIDENAPQREYPLREVFNAVRYLARCGGAWRMLPNDFPPWAAVYQQTQRWIKAGVFEEMVHDLRTILRLFEGRNPDPTAAILDSRTLQSTPESGGRAGYDGAKKKKGSKVHAAVDTLGHPPPVAVAPHCTTYVKAVFERPQSNEQAGPTESAVIRSRSFRHWGAAPARS